jgi:hypothetical protein
LVEEAKRTLDQARRKELYTEAWQIVNVELPHFHLHEETSTSAAVKELRGYQPASAAAYAWPIWRRSRGNGALLCREAPYSLRITVSYEVFRYPVCPALPCNWVRSNSKPSESIGL